MLSIEAWPQLVFRLGNQTPTWLDNTMTGSVSKGLNSIFNDDIGGKPFHHDWACSWVSSEAELAVLFYNCKQSMPLWITLTEMGHAQPKTVIITNNSLVHGLITKIMLPKTAKLMDMSFHWLKCQEASNQFMYQWKQAMKPLPIIMQNITP